MGQLSKDAIQIKDGKVFFIPSGSTTLGVSQSINSVAQHYVVTMHNYRIIYHDVLEMRRRHRRLVDRRNLLLDFVLVVDLRSDSCLYRWRRLMMNRWLHLILILNYQSPII